MRAGYRSPSWSCSMSCLNLTISSAVSPSSQLVHDLIAGRAVALGFEAPLWMPYATEESQLGRARPNEHSSWSAAAGATVLAYGIQQMTYVLHRIASGTRQEPPTVSLDPSELQDGVAQLLVWEAFVSGRAKDDRRWLRWPGVPSTGMARFSPGRRCSRGRTGRRRTWHLPGPAGPPAWSKGRRTGLRPPCRRAGWLGRPWRRHRRLRR